MKQPWGQGETLLTVSYQSIGIDVGTSTFHYVVSRIHQIRNPLPSNPCPYRIESVEVLYRSPIFLTPYLKNVNGIDAEQVLNQIQKDMQESGCNTADIETGAVIVTGMAARQKNAERVVNELASLCGAMVSTIAGSRLESLLSARGAGADCYSREHFLTHVNVDIGGGTSNIAIYQNGELIDLASLWIGGRMAWLNSSASKWKFSEAAQILLAEKTDGSMEERLEWLADRAAQELYAYLRTGAVSTPLIDSPFTQTHRPVVNSISFSGGVGLLVNQIGLAGEAQSPVQDLGVKLAQKLLRRFPCNWNRVSAPEAIRATVLGVGIYTVQLSGDTVYCSELSLLPLRDVPVIRIQVDSKCEQKVELELSLADALYSSHTPRMLFLEFSTRPSYSQIDRLSILLQKRMADHADVPFLIAFNYDMAKLFGYRMEVLLKDQPIKPPIVALDGIDLSHCTYCDIGKPLTEGIIPVSAKTLYFNTYSHP